MLDQLKAFLTKAQSSMKHSADQHRRDVSFAVGDSVFLKLRPYRQSSVAKRLCQKLAAKFYGPFEVLERVGKVAYRLKLPESSRIHPVFHVSQLKPVVGTPPQVTPLPQSFSSTGELLLRPEAVLGTRYTPNGCLEVLIQWTGLPSHESTWNFGWEIQRQFPEFQLEDKLRFVGRGIDTLQQVYFRKRGKKDTVLEATVAKGELSEQSLGEEERLCEAQEDNIASKA